MRSSFLLTAAAALLFLQACTERAGEDRVVANVAPAANEAARTANGGPYASVPRISLAEAKADFDAGTAVFIDTHSPATFRSEHISGAINVPTNDMDAHLNKIPKGKKLIAYCS